MITMDLAAVYDIETEDWDTFVCGGLYTADGDYYEATWENEREYLEQILSINGIVAAHNGGRFDHLWFLDALDRYGYLSKLSVALTMSGASIVRMQVRGPNVDVDLIDTWRIFPLSLRRLSGDAKDDCGLECEGKGECQDIIAYKARYPEADSGGRAVYGCGGYCAIKRTMPRAKLRRVMDYCRQDCIALWNGVQHMLTVAEGLEIDVGYTVGGTAWRTARALAGIEPQTLPDNLYHYARSGYYGGRVGLFKRFAASGHQYDITSSYPFQCSQNLPVGVFRYIHCNRSARAAYRASTEGIYTAQVMAPVMDIPVLPIRAKLNGEVRLTFPVGYFRGTWALPELQYAESLGYRIEPLQCLTFSDSEPILGELMEVLIAARLKFGKKSREGEWLKLVANSLYGKLASRPENTTIFVNPTPEVLLGTEWPMERIGARVAVYKQTREKVPECGHIAWAAYITARARVQLHKQLVVNGGSDALYCDTDSVFSTKPRNDVGTGLGDWAYEGPFQSFQGIAPKIYRYLRDGIPHLRAKGVVLPGDVDKAWDCIREGRPVISKSRIRGLRTAIRSEGKLFCKEVVKRLVTEGFGDRMPQANGCSRPPHVSELEFIDTELEDEVIV